MVRFTTSGQGRVTLHPFALVLAACLRAAPAAAQASCEPIPHKTVPAHGLRDIRAQDLVGLRDIGQPDAAISLGLSPLAPSPDGRAIAFIVTRADAATNSNCRALVVIGVHKGSVPHLVDRGGELITVTESRRGLVQRGGFPDLVIPVWSPDGKRIAYLRRDKDVTQAWIAVADGSGARAATRSAVDIEALAWSADGRHLIVASRPASRDQEAEIATEGETGFLYDERFVPPWGPRPQLRSDMVSVNQVVDIENATLTPASAADAARLETVASRYLGGAITVRSPGGMTARTEHASASLLSPRRIIVTSASGIRTMCNAVACAGHITEFAWLGDGRLAFVRREGWANGDTGLYIWRLGALPRRIVSTADALLGCQAVDGALICLREGAASPRHIVRIDPQTGASETVFDPNPEFAGIRLGTVERFKWRNALGLETYADVAFPPAYRSGRLPLVITQYTSRGFLRGGTGDEYPVFLLAAHGFAVMSLERPVDFATTIPNLATYDAIEAANAKGWADRRSVLSAIEAGVRLLVDKGLVDPTRVGITGLSDGATMARFALINSPIFAAASISTCCLDPHATMTYGGPAWAASLQAIGYPPLKSDAPDFWGPISSAVSAGKISAPLLMQLSDDEYLLGLETFTALRDRGKPVEMVVFPGEHHAKFQPRHRLAIYDRNVAWFDFWLRGVEDPGYSVTEIERWRALRAARDALRPSPIAK